MPKKMGRPTVPKTKAKTILRGAMFAPDEIKRIDQAIARAGTDNSKWIRNELLWAAERTNVRSDQFTSRDLDGQSISFYIFWSGNEARKGDGLLTALQRGDGSMDVRIYSRFKFRKDPLEYSHIPLSQKGMDLLKRNPPGSQFAFSLIDPSLQP